MANTLKIDGFKSLILNSNINVEVGIFLNATYKGRAYDLSEIKAVCDEGKVRIALYRFIPEDRKNEADGLNNIVLATTFQGRYRAVGISQLSKVHAKATKFYRMGDDLEILVSKEAEDAINSLKDARIQIARAEPGLDMPREYLTDFSLN